MAPMEDNAPRWRNVLQIVEQPNWDRSPISDGFILNTGRLMIWVEVCEDWVQVETTHTGTSRRIPPGELDRAHAVVHMVLDAREKDQKVWKQNHPEAAPGAAQATGAAKPEIRSTGRGLTNGR